MSKVSVLVVEDEEALRGSVVRSLISKSYEVTAASSADEALRYLSLIKVDLVLTDFNLGGAITGLQLIQKIKALLPQVPCGLMSGNPNLDEDEVRAAGAQFFLHKPFTPRDLLLAVVGAQPGRRPGS